jgi:hypothetical protein
LSKVAEMLPNVAEMLPNVAEMLPNVAENNYSKYPNNDCPNCGKHFKLSNSIPRHIRMSCKKVTTLVTTDNNQQSSNTNIRLYSGTIINNTTNNIVLTGFKHEDLQHITTAIKAEICSKKEQSITSYMEKVYFNDNYPQNKNMRIKSDKRGEIELFNHTKQRWMTKMLDDISVNISKHIFNRVRRYFYNDDVKELLDDTIKECFSAFISEMNMQNPEVLKCIQTQVKTTLKSYRT